MACIKRRGLSTSPGGSPCMCMSIRSFARHSGYNRYWDYRELAIHDPSVNLNALPPTSYLCTQATVAASVSGSAGTEEVTETSAPVDLRTHPPPQLTRSGRLQPPASHIHSERAVTTARVTHSIHVVASLSVRYLRLKPKTQLRSNVHTASWRARRSTVANRAPPNCPRFPNCSSVGRPQPSTTSPKTRKLLSGDLIREPRAT